MDKVDGILKGGIASIGPDSGSGRNQYSPFKAQKKPIRKFKRGEVLLGTVLEKISHKLIKVRLPHGTFTAEVNGRLKKGDTLFFYVENLDSNLILNIYGVSPKASSGELSIAEIIRILNLEDKDATRMIVKELIEFRSIILRKEVYNFANLYEKIEPSLISSSDAHALADAIVTISDSEIEHDLPTIDKLMPLFRGAAFIRKQLEKLVKLLDKIDDKEKSAERLRSIIKLNNGNNFYFLSSESQFFKHLKSLTISLSRADSNYSDLLDELSLTASQFSEFFLALDYWNLYASEKNLPARSALFALHEKKIIGIILQLNRKEPHGELAPISKDDPRQINLFNNLDDMIRTLSNICESKKFNISKIEISVENNLILKLEKSDSSVHMKRFSIVV